jgi:pilus assembly protein CpaF
MTEDHMSNNGLDDLFNMDKGSQRMNLLLNDPAVQDIRCNSHDRIYYTDATGSKFIENMFPGPSQYEAYIDQLLLITDVGYTHLKEAKAAVIEGSFRQDRTAIKGSIFIATNEITRGAPVLVIRKQPTSAISLDQMLEQGMLSVPMRMFLEQSVRGRLNIMIAGGSGAGKTTMARALSAFVDPSCRIVTCEEIDELNLDSSLRLTNVVALTSYRELDERGALVREETLEDLVRHALRMRADRIWVGETRGREAYALVKACLSGHDGSITTLHANSASQAIKQLVSYVMESGMTEEVARDQVSQAFHLAIQIQQVKLGRRVVTEIVELESVREGGEQRRNDLWRYDFASDSYVQVGSPSPRLKAALERNNVNYMDPNHFMQQGAGGWAR